jgi:flagellar basal-body rod protein FlgF
MDAIDLMASAMHAMQSRVDVAAANLANASTDGFRRSVARVSLGRRGLTATASVDEAPGALRHTGRALDLSVTSTQGGMLVRDAAGRVALVRSASFERVASGEWHDAKGRALLGEHGALRAGAEATVDERGVVTGADGSIAGRIALADGATVQSGFIEASNVDAVGEMVDLLAAQRSFETAQKTLSAIDDVRARAAGDVGRVKP